MSNLVRFFAFLTPSDPLMKNKIDLKNWVHKVS